MSTYDDVMHLVEQVQRKAARTAVLRSYLDGRPARAYLSRDSTKALEGKLSAVSVNWSRLIVSAHSDRLRVQGLQRNGVDDPKLWAEWAEAGGTDATERMIHDRLAYGTAYLSAWTDEQGRPMVMEDSPATMAVKLHALTGRVLSAVRTWTDDMDTHALYYTSEAVHHYTAKGVSRPAGAGWDHVSTTPHSLRAVPVVPFRRRMSGDDWQGVSIIEDVLPLIDAQNKLLADMLTSSEYVARPRRWATGLEIQEDEDGNPVDPFGDSRLLQSEAPETKFGQLPAGDLSGYSEPIRLLTEQIAALAALPPSYLGLHGQQTANAEGTRAAETQLTSRAYNEQKNMSKGIGRMAAIVSALSTGRPVADDVIAPGWESPEIRTPGQAADSAQKLQAMGVPLESLLSEVMHWTPEAVRTAVDGQRRAALDQLVQRMGQ